MQVKLQLPETEAGAKTLEHQTIYEVLVMRIHFLFLLFYLLDFVRMQE
jgi:hypothetical protein